MVYHCPMLTVILLLVAGLALLLLETMLPGMVAGIVGFVCLVAGVVISYRDLGPAVGHIILLCVVAALITGVVLWLKYFPQSRVGKLFVSESASGDLGIEYSSLLSKEGVARSTLRPSGTAVIEGKRYDVVSEGGFIDPETPIKVVAVEGSRIVVRAKY